MLNSLGLFSDLPGRYSHSLFSISSELGVLDVVSNDISLLEAILLESTDFNYFLTSPVFPISKRKIVVEDLIIKASLCGTTGNFLRILLVNGRLNILSSIIKSFNNVCLHYRNEIIAHVRTFAKMSSDQQDKLRSCLEKIVCKSIVLDLVEDRSLMGGFVVEVDCNYIDSSLRTKLFSLSLSLILKEVN
ncbi:ATP synthase F1 subunit delta [Candidatus Liberibacter americanus]|uniref:ATP synthase subunit delta n=1 Tax=Candidatus Liberibacter americanus str. Sao Paulo TaxID=1261131 RepID=U6B931_9HYPH|nr:ATP synthase F1 subunit delta [Candidatus Liberibacter americanus]AHA28366.1 F0F1-type ATP synthase delta subunit [Candidatus Liberibacter americanus str. Sao Paulo]EMS36655.1 ATP synthase F0F1 subunit delta [Candidatus Liberibacter americanus PW_SP]